MFKIGSVVKLKSGSPLMTVKSIEKDMVTCVWIHDNINVQSATFHEDMIVAS